MISKNKKLLTVILLIILLTGCILFYSCDNDGSKFGTTSVDINVSGTTISGKVTLVFPNTIDATRRYAIKTKFEAEILGGDLEVDAKAILTRGLTITIIDTGTISFGIRPTSGNKHLEAQSEYVEQTAGNEIGGAISIAIENSNLIARSAKEAVYMAKAPTHM